MAHLPTRHDSAEPPPPCLQSTESRSPIPIAKDVFGTVIGRDSHPEFADHMTMSGSQALIQLVGPSASVLAMGTNPVAIWGADGSTCTLLRRGERSRLLFNGDRISLVAQPTGQVDAGCTYTFVLDDQQLQETDEALKAPLKVLTPGAVPTLAAKTSVPKIVRKFGRQRAALAGPSAAAVDDITGSDTFEPMEPDFNLFCLQSGIPLPTDAYLSRFEEFRLPWLEELEPAALKAICDQDNIDYEAAEAQDAPALAARIREIGHISLLAAREACRAQGSSAKGNKSVLLGRLQGEETGYFARRRCASADAVRAQVALLTSSRRAGLREPKGIKFAYPDDVTCLVVGAHPSLERDSITFAHNSRTGIFDQLVVALTGESEERVEELLDGFETSNISITGDQSIDWLIHDAVRTLILIGKRAFEASDRGERLAVVLYGKLAELLRQLNLDPLKMFDVGKSHRLGYFVDRKLEATRTFEASNTDGNAWGPFALMTFAQSTLMGRSSAPIRVVDGDKSVWVTAGWLWHPNYVEGAMAASLLDRPMSLWRDVLSGRPNLPEMTIDLRELRSLLKKTKPKAKAVDTKRAKKDAGGSSRGSH